nr:MAG TPA: hypothetical protein [Microviridae sp.]
MKKDYVIFYISADGKFYDHSIIPAISVADAYKTAKMFCKKSGLTLTGVVEKHTFKDNCQIFNF